MKRNYRKFIFMPLLAFCALFFLNSCLKKEDLTTRCNDKANKVSEALTTWASELSESACEDYKDAMQDYINTCSAWAAYNAALASELNSLDCSQYAK